MSKRLPGSKLTSTTRRVWEAVKRRLRRGYERRDGLDLRTEPGDALARRALLSYIVHPFVFPDDDPRLYGHINQWHARRIVETLNLLGYTVDAVDYRDTRFTPRLAYDLFIGHGGINFEQIGISLPPRTPKIYFSTGAYWRFHNQQEHLRFEALQQRRGITLPPDRLISHSEETALLLADGILGFGNAFTRRTYADFAAVEMIDGTARADPAADLAGRDPARLRANFLYFASHGAVHKGLDLLLEAFTGLDLHLWIMAPVEPAFRITYRGELRYSPNIHYLGRVRPRSRTFYRTLRSCAWSILPTCSEGQSHSTLECMSFGLIPVISREAGVDVDDFGLSIEDTSVEGIRDLVLRLANAPAAEIRRRAVKARSIAQTRYTETVFPANFTRALQSLLDARRGE